MLRAIIIDDEKNCIDTLQLMLSQKFAAELEVAGTAHLPKAGIELIAKLKPDVVFLDVEMPGMSGIELLQSLPLINFQVIFTTAHQHYALQAIKLNALDYLTKPISLDELSAAIQKCKRSRQEPGHELLNNFLQQIKTNSAKKIALPNGNTIQYIPVMDITRIESQSNYSIVHFTNRPKQTVAKTLKELEEQLLPHNFLRIHHSHLINLEYVIGFKNQDSGYVIMHGNELVEISRRRKQLVMEKLNAL